MKPIQEAVFRSNIEILLESQLFNIIDFNFLISPQVFDDPVKIGEISIGYLRSGDKVGTGGNEDMTIWYQDGTKRTINKTWFE